jgi:ribose transport system ATP-binding protein
MKGQLKTGDHDLELARTSIPRLIQAGIVLVPEQRTKDGIAQELSVRDNITLPNLLQRGRPWFLSNKWQSRDAEAAVHTFGIRPQNTELLVKTLSGGNQQKVLLAKWLGAAPKVLVLHEPTQAVDVAARRDILLAIRRAAAQGVAVVMVSGEPSDLCAICSRIYIAAADQELTEIQSRTPDEILRRIYSTPPDHEKV